MHVGVAHCKGKHYTKIQLRRIKALCRRVFPDDLAAALIGTAVFILGQSAIELAEILHGQHLMIDAVDALCDICKGIVLRRKPH